MTADVTVFTSKEILKKCILCTVVTGATLSAVACIWSEPLLAIYNQDPAVLAAGAVRLRMVVIPYVIFGIADVLTGAIRGCGSPMRPVVINLLCTCVFRLAWIAAIDTDTMAPTGVCVLSGLLAAAACGAAGVLVQALPQKNQAEYRTKRSGCIKALPYVKIKSAGS